MAWWPISAEGLRLGYLTYDSDVLNPLRGELSGVLAKSGRWEVHYETPTTCPGSGSAPSTAVGPPCPWIHSQRGAAPFADFTLQHVRRPLAERGDEQGRDAIARALDDLLTRASTEPAPKPLASRRVTARTPWAATANPLRPVDPPRPLSATPNRHSD